MYRGSCPGCGSSHVNKKGYFRTKWNGQPVPRYGCRGCGRGFSSHTFRGTYRQKKPYLNELIFKWYVSGTTQRRMARVMAINRKTVARKFEYLSVLARQVHSRKLESGALRSRQVQFDEMESFEHTRLKPLSIAIAVKAGSGEILDAQVASMPYRGRLVAIAFSKYGRRPDNRALAASRTLRSVALAADDKLNVLTDLKSSYPQLIRSALPSARHHPVKAAPRPPLPRRANADDPLFTLNHTCAKIRHDLSRMARKVWTTTKKARYLQAHLDLYIAFNNGYSLAA